MPKPKINITDNIMQEIREGKVIMRPKIYFTIGSLLTFTGIIGSIIVSVFLISLTKFALRTHGPMGQFRLEQILTSFPWWAPIIAIIGLVTGIWLLKKFDFSYKKNFGYIILGIIAAALISGYIIDAVGLADNWFRRGPMRGIMRQYLQEENNRPDQFRKGRFNRNF